MYKSACVLLPLSEPGGSLMNANDEGDVVIIIDFLLVVYGRF